MSLFSKQELRRQGQAFAAKSTMLSESILRKSVSNFSTSETYDIFLSHSFRDADLILGIKSELEAYQYSVYIDWLEDPQLDRSKVSKSTANTLKTRMQNCSCLVFAHSMNSSESKWMPWELGYFDGIHKDMVAILPITESKTTSDSYQGQEYLGLYYYVSKGVSGIDGQDILWINEDPTTYITFNGWLRSGIKPILHK